MNYLNITNIHDNTRSKVTIGLDSKRFQIMNTGDTIVVSDSANKVTKLKVGGSNGFTINYSGGKISFTSNSGGLLAVSEPGRGGIEGCPFYYCHQDKYSGARAASISTMSLNSDENNEIAQDTSTNSSKINITDETKLPNPSELEDGTIMMVVNGHWVEYSFDDLYSMIVDKMNTEFTLHKI